MPVLGFGAVLVVFRYIVGTSSAHYCSTVLGPKLRKTNNQKPNRGTTNAPNAVLLGLVLHAAGTSATVLAVTACMRLAC